MGECSFQMTTFTPIFRSSRQTTSQSWLSDNPVEIRRNSSGSFVSGATSIIAPDLAMSQTRQSQHSCGSPKETCPVFKAWLRGSLLRSSATGHLRIARKLITVRGVKSAFVSGIAFEATDALDIAGAA